MKEKGICITFVTHDLHHEEMQRYHAYIGLIITKIYNQDTTNSKLTLLVLLVFDFLSPHICSRLVVLISWNLNTTHYMTTPKLIFKKFMNICIVK